MNREAWLSDAVVLCGELLAKRTGVSVTCPVRVSVGWSIHESPRRSVWGECWQTEASADGAAQIFVSPTLTIPIKVLATLVHELIHASDNGASGHRGHFAKTAKAAGLTGPMTATEAGEELHSALAFVADKLGPYPHAALRKPERITASVQRNRHRKLVCPKDGFAVRASRGMIDEHGMPICPRGHVMGWEDCL